MKSIKKLGSLIISIMLLGLFGCVKPIPLKPSHIVKGFMDFLAQKARDKSTKAVFENAIITKDHQVIKSLFSKFALANAPDIDDEINYLFESLHGDVLSIKHQPGSEYSSANYGVVTIKRSSKYEIETTENQYILRILNYPRSDEDKNKLGIHKMGIVAESDESEKNNLAEFFGNDGIIAGIYKPGSYPAGNVDKVKETAIKIILALKNKDQKALKLLFAQAVINDKTALNEEIGFIMNFINGEIEEKDHITNYPSIGGVWNKEKKTVAVRYRKWVKTGMGDYVINFYEIILDSQEPEQIGLHWLAIAPDKPGAIFDSYEPGVYVIYE